MAAFGQAMSQFLTDAGGLSPSVDAIDVAGNWPALPLAGLDDSAGYLASQPDYLTAQRDPIQPLPPDQVDSVKFAPESDIDPIIADDCASPSLPVPRTKGKLLRERQNVKKQCPNPMPLLTGPTSGSAGSAPDNKKPNENPRLYPGGQKRRLSDWFFGTQQEWKQCPPEKKTLCCTGAQEGELVRSCAYCAWLSKRRSFWRRVNY